MSRPKSGVLTDLWNVMGPPGKDAPPPREPREPRDGIDGKPGLIFCGEWEAKSYEPNCVVTWEGSSWVSTQKTRRSQEPSEHSLAWLPLALKGSDGKDSVSTHLRTVIRRDESQPQLTPCTFQTIPKPGQALYVFDDAGKTDLAIANNVLTAKVIGLAAADGSQKFQADGIFELQNWQNVIGSIYLEPTRYYYLSASDAGMLSTVPPNSEGEIVTQCGLAISKTRLSLSLDSHVIEL